MRLTATFLLFALAVLPARADAPRVVADTPVAHSLAAQVMAGVGEPFLLLDRGADPHDFQLRPSQAAALAEADLVVWVGPELTPWMERALAAGGNGRKLALLDVPATVLLDYAEAGGHGHSGEDGHDHGKEGGHGRDPHAWLNPANAAVWTTAIAEALAAADPQGAARYRANAAAAQAGFTALDAGLEERLAPARAKPFAAYHDAYRYFAARYGLTISGTIASGDAHDPGAAHLSELETALAGSACLFPEAGHDTRAAETLAADTGLRLGSPLDPEGRLLDPGPGLYAALMTGLADAILACAGG